MGCIFHTKMVDHLQDTVQPLDAVVKSVEMDVLGTSTNNTVM